MTQGLKAKFSSGWGWYQCDQKQNSYWLHLAPSDAHTWDMGKKKNSMNEWVWSENSNWLFQEEMCFYYQYGMTPW